MKKLLLEIYMSEPKYNRTPEERERLRKLSTELILNGSTLLEICQETGFSAPTVNSIARDLGVKLKVKPDRVCKICKSNFQSKSNKTDICSKECRLEDIRLQSISKFTDPDTYRECGICGYRSPDLKIHILKVHQISNQEYRDITGQTFLTSESRKRSDSERVKGDKNPGFKHNGRLSPYSEKFQKGYNREKHQEYIENTKLRHKEHPELNPFNRSYYHSDESYIAAQTRDLSWFVNRYGQEEGIKRHSEKTEKWMKSFKKCNFSMVSQRLFDSLPESIFGDVYYATRERDDMKEYKNKEFILQLENG